MGITQQSAASRLIQPGVCTSSTRPASPFEGQAIFETDTDRMLIWNGTTWVMPNKPTTNPDGLELISSTDFSGSLVVSANNVFNSTYDFYTVECTITSSTSTEIGLRLQTGTNTPDTTSNYYRYGFYNLGGFSQFNAGPVDYLFFANTNSTAGVTSWTRLSMFNPFRSDTRTNWQLQHWDSQSGLQLFSSNQHATTTSFTGFRLYATNGTTTITGRLRVYGMRQ